MVSRIPAVLIALLPLLASVGCGGRAVYPVRGMVEWPDGKAAKELAGGMVQFDLITDDPKQQISPRGAILEDGSYRLTTFQPNDGAPAATYRVLVVPHFWTEGELGDKPKPPPLLDPRFQQFESAKIQVIVRPQSNDIPIKVQRAKKR